MLLNLELDVDDPGKLRPISKDGNQERDHTRTSAPRMKFSVKTKDIPSDFFLVELRQIVSERSCQKGSGVLLHAQGFAAAD